MSLNNHKICESFSWLAEVKDVIWDEKKPNSVRFKFTFAKANEISKNGRKYIDEELTKFARTLINRAINVNHENSKKIGTIGWAEYENGVGEGVGEINREPYVTLMKTHSSAIKGVSLQSNYIFCECSRCHAKFKNEADLSKHLQTVEYLNRDAVNVPRGMVAGDPCGLALVVGGEVPGCDTTVEVLNEMMNSNGFRSICETVLSEKASPEIVEEFRLYSNEVTQSMIKAAVSYQGRERFVRESDSSPEKKEEKPLEDEPKEEPKEAPKKKEVSAEEPEPKKEEAKEVEECPVCGEPLVNGKCSDPLCGSNPAPRPVGDNDEPVKEIKAPQIKVSIDTGAAGKVTLKESKLNPMQTQRVDAVSFEAVLKETKDEVQAAQVVKQTRQLNEALGAFTEKLNEIVFEVNKPIQAEADNLQWQTALTALEVQVNGAFKQLADSTPKDDVSWRKQYQALNEQFTGSVAKLQGSIMVLRESVASLPKDDLGWKEKTQSLEAKLLFEVAALTATKKQLEEAVSSLPTDDLGWKEIPGKFEAKINESIKSLQDSIAKVPVYDDKALLSEIVSLKAANTQLNDLCTKQAGQITELSNAHKVELAEVRVLVESQKKDFEMLLAVADKNIEETRKSLEERIAELKTQNEAKETEIKSLNETVQKEKVLNENMRDKVKGGFRGHGKQLEETSGSNEAITDDPLKKKGP